MIKEENYVVGNVSLNGKAKIQTKDVSKKIISPQLKGNEVGNIRDVKSAGRNFTVIPVEISNMGNIVISNAMGNSLVRKKMKNLLTGKEIKLVMGHFTHGLKKINQNLTIVKNAGRKLNDWKRQTLVGNIKENWLTTSGYVLDAIESKMEICLIYKKTAIIQEKITGDCFASA